MSLAFGLPSHALLRIAKQYVGASEYLNIKPVICYQPQTFSVFLPLRYLLIKLLTEPGYFFHLRKLETSLFQTTFL